jgi:hypothetical protein
MSAPRSLSTAPHKTRVRAFWRWFAGRAQHYSHLLQNSQLDADSDVMQEWVALLHPELGWEMGWNQDRRVSFLTVTGQGNRHLQYLAAYWASSALAIPGWEFFGMKQPTQPLRVLQYNNVKITPNQIWVVHEVNEDDQLIDLQANSIDLPEDSSAERSTIFFLMLDSVLGEHASESWIGTIAFSDRRLKNAIPLSELPAVINDLKQNRGWHKPAFGEAGVIYRLPADNEDLPRGDIIVGRTRHFALIRDYIEAEARLVNPLAGSGAEFLYVAIPTSNFSPGQEADERGEIEAPLEAVLMQKSSGRVLGGAIGSQNCYIDLLIYDGEESRALIGDCLSRTPLGAGATLHPFTI